MKYTEPTPVPSRADDVRDHERAGGREEETGLARIDQDAGDHDVERRRRPIAATPTPTRLATPCRAAPPTPRRGAGGVGRDVRLSVATTVRAPTRRRAARRTGRSGRPAAPAARATSASAARALCLPNAMSVPVRQAEEVADLVEGRPGVGEELVAVHDVQPVAAEQPGPGVRAGRRTGRGSRTRCAGGARCCTSGRRPSVRARPAIRSGSSSSARSNGSVSKPRASSCAWAEYARSTGSRSSTSSFTSGRSRAIRSGASGWNM